MISFVGAGPGAADLLTLRATERLAAADVVVWAASLVAEEVLRSCRDDVILHDSAAMTLEDVTAVFAAHPNAAIVRLHSGDPTVYSAVAEQIDWCRRHGREHEIVPGVSSMAATAAAVGRELTVPGLSQTVVLTRLAQRTAASVPAGESVAEMARRGATMALHLSAARPEALQAELLCEGSAYTVATPAVIGYRVSWPEEEIVLSTVGALAADLVALGRTTSVLVLVGDALADAEVPARSHVYSASHGHAHRAATLGPPPAASPSPASRTVTVVGLHGGQPYGPAATAALESAGLVVGSPRHLDATARLRSSTGPTLPLTGPLDAVIERIGAAAGSGIDVCVLASGDPGFFGIVRALGQRVGPARLAVHPAPSSVALAFARIGIPWDDALVVSAHGRPLDAAVEAVTASSAPSVAVLTAPDSPPEALGRALLAAGVSARKVIVASHLGDAREAVTRTDLAGLAAGTFDPMSVVVLREVGAVGAAGPQRRLAWGLPEAAFEHRDGMITKAEVRAVALGKLDLPARGLLWDLGAGSGAVAVECARLVPALRVVAIERDAEQAARIRANAARHRVAVEVVQAAAPAALAALDDPDRVFVGGGGLDVLDEALRRLRPGGTVVATYALVERALGAAARLGHLVQLSVSRGVATGELGLRFRAENPVFLVWGPD